MFTHQPCLFIRDTTVCGYGYFVPSKKTLASFLVVPIIMGTSLILPVSINVAGLSGKNVWMFGPNGGKMSVLSNKLSF